jgi:SAM-dependent methyltransferase
MNVLSAERHTAEQWLPPWVRFQHEARYAFVAERAAGLRVLDVACGDGRSAECLLAGGATSVAGFDTSPEAIKASRRRGLSAVATFTQASGTALPVEDASFDLCVSLETIEHVDDDRAFVRELQRAVRPGGTLILSTPNRRLTNPCLPISGRPYNPFHVREYCRGELDKLLSPHFSERQWFGQSWYKHHYLRKLEAIATLWPRAAVRAHQFRKLIGMRRETLERHKPVSWRDDEEPEILMVVCRADG